MKSQTFSFNDEVINLNYQEWILIICSIFETVGVNSRRFIFKEY